MPTASSPWRATSSWPPPKRPTISLLTVEDHYPEGGLGDAVAGELSAAGVKVHKLAVFELPRSGKPDELLAKYGLDANAIIQKAKALF